VQAAEDEAAGQWELYNLERDPTELENVASANPDRLAELTAAWRQWAETHQVLPKLR
jgi:arylsulfatase